MCPWCQASEHRIVKNGFFVRHITGPRRSQRYRCRECKRSFSDQTASITYRDKKPHYNQPIFRMLCSGMSQRRCAFLLHLHQDTVARKMAKLGAFARAELYRPVKTGEATLLFDEMETFEHTKCKPVSIVIAVVEKERRIVAINAASMPAKGRLAEIARRRYGKRADHRPRALRQTFRQLTRIASPNITLKSDECPRYPKYARQFFPSGKHLTFKGRRACVVGYGEMKKGGFDPLFDLNHSCAMVRDNLKRMARRTWCTTKRIRRLQALLDMYGCFHNQRLGDRRRVPRLGEVRTQ